MQKITQSANAESLWAGHRDTGEPLDWAEVQVVVAEGLAELED